MLDIMRGAFRSNTIQFNSIFLAIWGAIMQTNLVADSGALEVLTQPAGQQWTVVGILLANLLLRGKTKKPLAER